MSTNNLLFPNGRPAERVKQDAQALSKAKGIPLNVALDEAAANNGMNKGWNNAINELKRRSHEAVIPGTENLSVRLLAQALVISEHELAGLEYEILPDKTDDGEVFSYVVCFSESSPRQILDKIPGLTTDGRVQVGLGVVGEKGRYG